MSIPDNYEINVAKKRNPEDEYGVHFCTIQLSETFTDEAEEKLDFFRKLFGEDFRISMTHWECRGKHKEGWE